MEFDEVLEQIGDIGFYQITLFLMLGAWEFMGADAVAMNFIGGYMDHWCKVRVFIGRYMHHWCRVTVFIRGNMDHWCKVRSLLEDT